MRWMVIDVKELLSMYLDMIGYLESLDLHLEYRRVARMSLVSIFVFVNRVKSCAQVGYLIHIAVNMTTMAMTNN